jgi:hypothetical protein
MVAMELSAPTALLGRVEDPAGADGHTTNLATGMPFSIAASRHHTWPAVSKEGRGALPRRKSSGCQVPGFTAYQNAALMLAVHTVHTIPAMLER